jgi:hypothetical protein
VMSRSPHVAYSEPERYHPRVEANLKVKVFLNGQAYSTKAKDLSMAGLCLAGSALRQFQRVTVAIPLPDDREVVAECAVKRLLPDGVGVEFEDLDWEDLFALARFLHPRLP